MKKHVLAFVIMSISFLSVAADRYFKSSSGAWSDASNWYEDKDCTLSSGSIPISGDTATITLGSAAIISEGDWIEGVTISIPGSTTSFASLTMDGGTITNCDINVGAGNVMSENGKQAIFTMNGGVIEGQVGGKRHSLSIGASGKFCQNGGLVHQYQATILGMYDHIGGINAIRGGAFYVNVPKSETSGYHIDNNAIVSTWLAYNSEYNEMSSFSGDVFKNVPVLSDSNAGRIEVPNGNGVSAKLTISKVETKLPALWIASKRNDATNTQTGIVEVVQGSKIHFTGFGSNNSNTSFNNTNSYSAFIVKDSTVSNFVFSHNGTKTDALAGRTRFDIVLSNSYICASALDPETDYQSYIAAKNNDTTIGRGVALTIGEGSRYYAGAIMMNAGSKLMIDGGFLETATILASDQDAAYAEVPHSIIVRNGGVLMSSVAHNYQVSKNESLRCRYYIGSKHDKTTVNPSFFILDNGSFLKRDNTYGKIQLGYSGSQNVSRFEVRGKSTMRDIKEDSTEPKGFYVEVGESNCAEFIFKGGEHDINLSSLGDSTHRYLLEFIADKSSGNIAPVIFHRNNNSQDCGGDLRISLDGNVLLTTNTSFEIIKRTQRDLYSDFHSLPEDVGSTLWTISREGRIASAALTPSLSLLGTDASFVPENPLEMGSLDIKIGSTNKLVRFAFELSLKAADGTTSLTTEELESLAAELENAGYYESCVKDGGLFVNFPLELVTPKTVHHFVWDFTKTNGAKDLDNVTIKAKVAEVRSAVEYDRDGLQFIIR